MEDCQNEIDKAIGKYCPNCGQKAELDGRQLHSSFCVQYIGTRPADVVVLKEPNFAQLPGFPDYEAYRREAKEIIALEVSSLGDQAQTLAARMPALLKAAEEAAQHDHPSPGLLDNIEKIQAINLRDSKEVEIDAATWFKVRNQAIADIRAIPATEAQLSLLRAQALAEQKAKEDAAQVECFVKLVARVFFGENGLGRTTDPDGALTPLPAKPIPTRTVSAPRHDFIGALYKPYMSPI